MMLILNMFPYSLDCKSVLLMVFLIAYIGVQYLWNTLVNKMLLGILPLKSRVIYSLLFSVHFRIFEGQKALFFSAV